jgi:adenine-specific DNA-methyltransferase
LNKLMMTSPNNVLANIDKIAALFPNVATESKGEDGKITRAIDFELLKQELSGVIVEGEKERYQLTWPGKKEAILNSNTPIDRTLRPVKQDSMDWEHTQNLYFEGDNLEVLKLLQESYLNKIKCIYIDPPYNTGNDFIYVDNFHRSSSEYLSESGQIDEEANRLFQNTETNGRFHSDWLTMMYSRLKVSRNLLSEDGIIFISIDDSEVANIKNLCNEVFGEFNFVANIVWQKKTSPDARTVFSAAHDHIVVYAKDINRIRENISSLPFDAERKDSYSNPDNDLRGPWASVDLTGQVGRAPRSQFYTIKSPMGNLFPPPEGRCWALAEKTFYDLLADNRIWFGKDGNARPRLKKFLSESEGTRPWTWWDNKSSSHNQEGNKEVKALFNNELVFDNPKPTKLLKKIYKICTKPNKNEIVLDFFGGSSSTADAVMQLNAEEGGNRRFIIVQMPETLKEAGNDFKAASNALRLGYHTISEIGKERIRLAAKKIKEETGANIDYGFRVYCVDSSNMKDVFYTPDKLGQMNLDELASNIKENRSGEDLLIQVMLEAGLELSLPMESNQIEGRTIYKVAGNSLIACFDEDITESIVKKIAEELPLRVVFRDSSFRDDSARINVEELFKVLSPSTEIQVL